LNQSSCESLDYSSPRFLSSHSRTQPKSRQWV